MAQWLWALCALLATGAALADEAAPRLMVQAGHGERVWAVAASPDGKFALSGDAGGAVILWEAQTGRIIRRIAAHRGTVNRVAFLGSATRAATGGADGMLRLWDLATGQMLREISYRPYLDKPEEITDLAASRDGQRVAVLWDHMTVGIYSAADGKRLVEQRLAQAQIGLAFCRDDKDLIMYSYNGTVQRWSLDPVAQPREIFSGAGNVASFAISVDGRYIALGGGASTVHILDGATGRERHSLSVREAEYASYGEVGSLAFIGDELVAVTNGSIVSVVDAATGILKRTMGGPRLAGLIKTVAAVPQSGFLLTGADLDVGLWDVAKGEQSLTFGAGAEPVTAVAALYDGSRDGDVALLAGSGAAGDVMQATHPAPGYLRLWSLAKGAAQPVYPPANGFVPAVAAVDGGAAGAALVERLLPPQLPLSSFGSVSTSIEFVGQDGKITRSLALPVLADSLRCPRNGHACITAHAATSAAGASNVEFDLFDLDSGKMARKVGSFPGLGTFRTGFDETGSRLFVSSDFAGSRLLELATGREIAVDSKKVLGFSSDGKSVFATDGYNVILPGPPSLYVLSASDGAPVRSYPLPDARPSSLHALPDGKTLLLGIGEKLWLLDAAAGKFSEFSAGHSGTITEIAMLPDGRHALTASADRSVLIWDVGTGKWVARLVSFADNTWAVVDPEGRFDTDNLEEIRGLHWIMPDDPLTPVALEAFMKEYYEPRLLPRILSGARLRPVPSLMRKNRVQPEVRVAAVQPDARNPERVQVTVEVSGAQRTYVRDGKPVTVSTAAHDLRLFRDGQMVGYVDGKVAEPGRPWRKTFPVRLPSGKAGQEVTFSAYAVNDDRVKSLTARASYRVPSTLVARKGRAYVISMGVNTHDNPAWNLKFAANDARLVRRAVADTLARTGQYQEVIPVTLVSDGAERHAAKAALRAVLDRLAGKPARASPAIPGAERLQAATPDDLILLTFSGHGFADDAGNFFLINQDTGKGSERAVTDELRQRSISSDELSAWLRDVDAGDMTMIVDACQSAASIQGNGFKPGPMGSRGLGQLSFDKGMRILTASQADEYALEDEHLQQGLLTFSLVTDGLAAFNADREPRDGRIMLDEWLHYGVDRVPQLAQEVLSGRVQVAGRGVVLAHASGGGKARPAQQPALFDFTRKRPAVEMAAKE